MRKWLIGIGSVFFILILIAVTWIYFNRQDQHPGYQLQLDIQPTSHPSSLKIGFSALPITPELSDTWQDANADAVYDPEDGDTFQDQNNNGKFDAVWLAGFHTGRPAQGIHDHLWARSMVIDDGHVVLSITVLDAIGFGHDDVLEVRQYIGRETAIDYAMINSTHVHEAPDLQGLWGPAPLRSGVDPAYLKFVKKKAARSVINAKEHLRPAYLILGQDLEKAASLVGDTRPPQILDNGIRILQALDQDTHQTLGTLITWGNHPETLWSKNLMITSDFPHFLREGVENGVYHQDSLYMPGLGGTTLFINGAIGGLMTTHPEHAVKHPFADTAYQVPSFDKAKAQGDQLALWVLQTLTDSTKTTKVDSAQIRLLARSFDLPLHNNWFRILSMLGTVRRSHTGWMSIRSEVAAWQLGPASFICVPGEIYPEIVNGGVEAPAGQDFSISPVETPPLRDLMPGTVKFVFGLSNDQIGYIIPKSQWDEKEPYTYQGEDNPYGEINSLGPETAPIIYRNLKQILEEL